MMKKICAVSGKEFEISEKDLEFYKNMGVPSPTLCPKERMRRRLAYRNERFLHRRECAGTGKKIISMYSESSGIPVFENEYWWSDNWSGFDYGKDFDFSKPFFEQFFDLVKSVPKMARIQQGENENSKFTNCASWNKNCYLLFSANKSEDCLYGSIIIESQNCVDCLSVTSSELLYECTDCTGNYDMAFCQKVHNSNTMRYCFDCKNSENCFACVNLRNKKGGFYVLNKKVSQGYFLKLMSDSVLQKKVLMDLRSLYLNQPRQYTNFLKSENFTGSYIKDSKNTYECWDIENLEDCKFCDSSFNAKDCYDLSFYGCTGTNELLYECEGCGHGAFNVRFSKNVWGGCQDIDYSYECFNSKNLLGCVGLKKAEYCILNKQYSKEEYFILRDKIIEHMKKKTPSNSPLSRGESMEWGEFFPMELSPFGYNETIAMEYFPLESPKFSSPGLKNTQEFKPGLENLKYNWKQEEVSAKYSGPKVDIPENISDVEDDICEKILTCEVTGKNYRIVKSELDFYRKMNLPIPKICPDERHKRRMALRPKRELFKRSCDNDHCGNVFETTFDSEKKEKVFCEKCYLDEVN